MWHRAVIRSKSNPLTLAACLQNGDSSASWDLVPSGESLCAVCLDGAPCSFLFASICSSGASLMLGFASRPQHMSKDFQKQPLVSCLIPGTEGKGQEVQADL